MTPPTTASYEPTTLSDWEEASATFEMDFVVHRERDLDGQTTGLWAATSLRTGSTGLGKTKRDALSDALALVHALWALFAVKANLTRDEWLSQLDAAGV